MRERVAGVASGTVAAGVIRRRGRSGSRSGALLIETLVALVLGVVVLGAFLGLLITSMRWSRTLAGRSEALEAVRTVWGILDEELRPGVVGRDWTPVAGTAIALRAFRGVARVCGPGASPGEWAIAYRGRRAPDPGRDSLLVLGIDGGWRAHELAAQSSGGGCSLYPGETAYRWSWFAGEVEAAPLVARLFESGEYHLADGALRYRRGTAPRQPLTPERFGSGSGFGVLPGGVEVRIEFRGDRGAGDLDPFVWPVPGQRGEVGP